jgi:DNA polymerase delta subunit 1
MNRREFIFQHLECVNPKKSDSLYIIGRTKENQSIACVVKDVRPHVCIQADTNASDFEMALNRRLHWLRLSSKAIREHGDTTRKTVTNVLKGMEVVEHVAHVEEIHAQDIMQYHEDGPLRFFKITVDSKYYMYDLKSILTNQKREVIYRQYYEEEEERDTYTLPKVLDDMALCMCLKLERVGLNRAYTIYNDQVDFMMQYFIDNDIYSCSWIKVTGDISDERKTSCDIEIDVIHLTPTTIEDMAPWKILTYDIESLPPPIPNRPGKYAFPTADKDAVITIGATLQNGKDYEQHVWILRQNGDIVESLPDIHDGEYMAHDTIVRNFHDEEKMLCDFFSFCIERDVDMIQGHNINRFDNKYMLERYHALCGEYPIWGRFVDEVSFIEERTFTSSQKGTHIQYRLHLPGRIMLDSFDIMKDQHNESSYKLDSLAAKYLGTKKVDMNYSDIHPKYQTFSGRVELAVYCVKDAWLVYKLMDKLCKLYVILQMAKVTGISMKDVMNRGQGIRTIALMLRFAKDRVPQLMLPRFQHKKSSQTGYIIRDGLLETTENEVNSSYQGAHVLAPLTGFYNKHVISCLDFASLYPSIMICMNMSFETLCYRKKIEDMQWTQGKEVRTVPDYVYEDELTTTINLDNPSFVTKDVRRGLLPEILETVLQERKRVKKMMKKEVPHSTMYKVYDGRQLGLKVVANSIYGFTGAEHGILPCKAIAHSVTKYGRGMILRAKSKIENHPVWGEMGCVCIYGDTDSVFIKIPRTLVDGDTRQELMENAHRMGERMAGELTTMYLPPNKLEYEKSYDSFLLLSKKRYAGYKYEPGLPPTLQVKGLECARRDYAPITVETQKAMLKALVQDQNRDEAIRIVDETVQGLFTNKIPLEKLIMSKKLSRPPSQYKSKAAHVELTKRLEKTNPEIAPVSGDRVEYIIYAGAGGVSDRACTPDEIRNGQLNIDINYYLTKQLQPPLLRILERIVDEPNALFKCRSILKQAGGAFQSWASTSKRKALGYVPLTVKRKKKEIERDIKSFFKQ